jgi:hypothetical protein
MDPIWYGSWTLPIAGESEFGAQSRPFGLLLLAQRESPLSTVSVEVGVEEHPATLTMIAMSDTSTSNALRSPLDMSLPSAGQDYGINRLYNKN